MADRGQEGQQDQGEEFHGFRISFISLFSVSNFFVNEWIQRLKELIFWVDDVRASEVWCFFLSLVYQHRVLVRFWPIAVVDKFYDYYRSNEEKKQQEEAR
jgi:hypothetical protein